MFIGKCNMSYHGGRWGGQRPRNECIAFGIGSLTASLLLIILTTIGPICNLGTDIVGLLAWAAFSAIVGILTLIDLPSK